MSFSSPFSYSRAAPMARAPASPAPLLAREKSLAAINRSAPKQYNVVVGVRSRPLSDLEISMSDEDVWGYDPATGRMFEKRPTLGQAAPAAPGTPKEHRFNFVFQPTSRTHEVYNALARPIVDACLEGFNGTMFAYGQTGSGKTYTLMGTPSEPGITLLAVYDVFRHIEAAVDTEFLIRVSYAEIYQEEIRDLLNPESGPLKIVDHPVTGPYVKGLTEEVVLSPERVMELLAIGEANRHVASTNMNLRSSRSHALFKMVIEARQVRQDPVTGRAAGAPGIVSQASLGHIAQAQAQAQAVAMASSMGGLAAGAAVGGSLGGNTGTGAPGAPSLTALNTGLVRVSALHLIDLAGSERVSKTGAAGVQVKESGVINASLLTLGVVIQKIITGDAHINYRDSKLTRLLSTSLGGNAKTAVCVTISPSSWNLGESRSSLQFAARAMKVVNRAKVNEIADEPGLVTQYRKEIEQLKAALLENRGGMVITADGVVATAEEVLSRMRRQHEESMAVLEDQLRAQLEATAAATARVTDLTQLAFVVSHGVGHLKSAPHVISVLADVAAGVMTATDAVAHLVATIPGFKKRSPRLLKSQQLGALGGSAMERTILEAAAAMAGPAGSPRAGEEATGVPPLMLSHPATAATHLLPKVSLATSSVDWSATGPSAGAARFNPVPGSPAAYVAAAGAATRRQLSGADVDYLIAAASAEARGGEALSPAARMLVAAGSTAAAKGLAGTLLTPSFKAGGGAGEEDSDSEAGSPVNTSQLDGPHDFGASPRGYGGISLDTTSAAPREGLEAAQSPLAAPWEELSWDYFSPASFSRQLNALFTAKESLSRTLQTLEEAVAAKSDEAAAAATAALKAQGTLKELQDAYDALKFRAETEAVTRSVDGQALQNLQEEVAMLRAQLADRDARKEALEEELAATRAGAEAELAALRAAAEADAASYEEQVRVMQGQMAELQAAVGASQRGAEGLDARLKSSETARATAEDEAARLGAEVAKLSARDEAAKAKLSEVLGEVRKAAEAESSLTHEVDLLRARLETAITEAAGSQATAGALRDQVSRGEEALTFARRRVAALEAEVADLAAAKAAAAEETKAAEARIADLEAELADATEDGSKVRERLLATMADHEAAQSALEQTSAALEATQAELAAARAYGKEQAGRVVELEAKAKELEARIATLAAESVDLQAAKAAVENALAASRAQHKATSADLERTIADLERTSTDLRTAREAWRAEEAVTADLSVQIAGLKDSLAERDARLEALGLRADTLTQALETVAVRAAEAETLCASLSTKLADTEAALELEKAAHAAVAGELEVTQEAAATARVAAEAAEADLRLVIAAREGVISAWEAKAAEMSKGIATLEADVAARADTIASLETELATRDADLAAARDSLAATEDALQAEKAAREAQVAELQAAAAEEAAAAAAAAEAAATAAGAREAGLREELEVRDTKLLVASSEISQLKTEVVRIQTLADAAAQAQESAVRAQRAAEDQSLQDREALARALREVTNLTTALGDAEAAASRQVRQVAALEGRISETEDAIATLRQALAASEASTAAARADGDELRAKLAGAEARAAAVQSELAASEEEVARVRTAVARLETDLAAALQRADVAERRVAALETDLLGSEAEIDRLALVLKTSQSETAAQTARAEAAEGKAARAGAEAEALRNDLTRAGSTTSGLVSERDFERAKAAGLETRLATAQASLQAAQEGQEGLQVRVGQLQGEIADLHVRMELLGGQLATARQGTASSEGEVAALRGLLTKAGQERDAARQRLAELEGRTTALTSQLADRHLEIEGLDAKVRAVGADRAATEEALREAQTRLARSTADLASATAHITTLREEAAAQRAAKEQTEDQVEALRARVAELEAGVAEAVAQAAAARDVGARIAAELEAADARASSLAGQVAALRGEAAAATAREVELLSQLEARTLAVSRLETQLDTSRAGADTLQTAITQLAAGRDTLLSRVTELETGLTEASVATQTALREAEGLRAELEAARATSAAALEARSAAEREGLAMATERDAASEKLRAVSAQLEAALSAAAHAAAQLEGVRADAEAARAHAKAEHVRASETAAALDEKTAQLAGLRRDMATMEGTSQSLQAQLTEARAARGELESLHAAVVRSLAAVRAELALQIEETNRARDDVVGLHRRLAQVEDARSAAAADATLAQSELEELRVALAGAKRTAVEARGELLRARESGAPRVPALPITLTSPPSPPAVSRSNGVIGGVLTSAAGLSSRRSNTTGGGPAWSSPPKLGYGADVAPEEPPLYPAVPAGYLLVSPSFMTGVHNPAAQTLHYH